MKIVLSDTELIERYKYSADMRYIGELYLRYTHLVSVLCMKYLKDITESEDAMMDIFEILTKDLKRHKVRNFKAWLYSVTKNHCLKRLKAKHFMQKDEGKQKSELFFMEFTEETDPEYEEVVDNNLYKLKKGIDELSEEQKKCIDLFFLKGKSYKEVAATTGYEVQEVKSYLQNGKRNLAIYLNKTNG